ncbi:hypothetical protein VPH35_139473 [Triticum aestivum]
MWPLRASRAGVLGTASCRFRTSPSPLAPTGPRQRPPPSSGSPPAPLHRPGRTWASVVSHQDNPATDGVVPAAVPGVPPTVLEPLRPLLAAQAEALGAELQALFAARLEVLFKPLQDLVAAVESWTAQVSSLWEPMEAIGGSQDLANVESAPPAMAVGEDCSALVVAGCSAELSEKVQSVDDPPALEKVMLEDDPPDLASVLPGMSTLEEPKVSSAPCTGKPSKELIQMGADEPLGRASSPWEEFLEELALTASSSPQVLQVGEAAPSLFERRSCRLDKKNKDCDIPVAKRAEYRRAEAFGEVPTLKSKGKASEEDLNEKMQHYLQMYKKEHTPKVIEAVRALV